MPRAALASLLCLLAIAGPALGAEPPAVVAAVDVRDGDGVAAATRWSASGEPSADGYRMSLSRGALDVGLDFQRRIADVRTADARFDGSAPPGMTLPALSLGLRSVSAPPQANSLVDRTFGAGAAVPFVSRVGIEYKPARSQVFFNQGLGFRLSGEDRVTMRLRKGSLGVYYKRNF